MGEIDRTPQRGQVRALVSALAGYEPPDDELDNLARAWPLTSHLLEMPLLTRADAFLRSLPDGLFWKLYALARDFREWSDPRDFDAWPGEYYYLVFLLASHERGRCATDEETITAARALAYAAIIEALRRDGRFSFVEAYSLTSGRPPRRIPTVWSETEH